MGLFGKKKEEEYEDDEELELEDELQDRKLTRKFKDLNSENKKKRKEPPKPWGRQERLIVLSVLVTTLIISGVLFLTSNTNFKFPNFSFNFSKPDFSSLNIFKEETIEIRKR